MSDKNAVVIRNMSKVFRFRKTYLTDLLGFRKTGGKRKRALQSIDLQIEKGDIVGLIGPNGAGKSTLLKIISGVMWPSEGTVDVFGSVAALLELGGGFNMQFTGRENVRFYCSVMGINPVMARDIVEEVKDYSDLGEFFDLQMRTYSSGMKARLGFSVSILTDPDILIIDEILAVGDKEFKKKSLKTIEKEIRGKTVIIVSHDMDVIRRYCRHTIWLNKGHLLASGDTRAVVEEYLKVR